MPSPKLVPVQLSAQERRALEGWTRRRRTAQALAMRSRIVLRCAEGGTIGQVAGDLGVSRDMVSKWRARFLRERLDGLADEPRPGRPRLISDEQVERVIAATLGEAPPNGDRHWSTRSMAAAAGMSQSAIARIWRAFGLKPHLTQTWKSATGSPNGTKIPGRSHGPRSPARPPAVSPYNAAELMTQDEIAPLVYGGALWEERRAKTAL